MTGGVCPSTLKYGPGIHLSCISKTFAEVFSPRELRRAPCCDRVSALSPTRSGSSIGMPAPIEDIIAKAIKDADKSFFNEDYAKQAKAVTAALKKAGYEVAPVKPPPGLVEWAKDNIPFGRLRPAELITQMYSMMVENVRRFDK
ncbi:hypothetical protein ACHMW5_22425 [Azospirillum melinis]